MQANLPVRAGQILLQENFQENDEVSTRVIAALKKVNAHEKLGDLYGNFGDNTKAMNYYIKSQKFQKAISLAKKYNPDLITKLHEKWGDFLMGENQKESAINHFVEAGAMSKAIEAAISAHQWNKAIQLLGSFSQSEAQKYCLKIAEKLQENQHFELAEKYYLRSNKPDLVIDMYVKNNKLKQALSFGRENFQEQELNEKFLSYAKTYENQKDYSFAEKIYIEIKMPEHAIKMYKGLQQWDKMLKLFSLYRPENIKSAHLLIAKKLQEEENFAKAEKHYIEGGKWTSAVDMYEERQMFEDCVRILKNYANDRDTVERAKKWDKWIGEQELVAILKKMYLTDSLIDFLCEKKKFEDAFKVAEGAKHKMVDIYL